jgi:hypothetical protein
VRRRGRTRDENVDWRADVVVDFERLRGRRVVRWRGVEMALRDGPGGLPEFEVDELPVIQLSILE